MAEAGAERLRAAAADLLAPEGLVADLTAALVAEPTHLARDGGFVAPGWDPELDETRALRDEGRRVIAGLEATYRADTGIGALKIRHNSVLGYFGETPAGHTAKMTGPPLDAVFRHRQTTANQVRFTTAELSDLETRILTAAARAQALEMAVFRALSEAVLDVAAPLQALARALAEIDVSMGLADLARGEGWVRPRMTRDRRFQIIGGRHPVVAAALRKTGGQTFVANDCDLSAEARPLWLLTGPNMAGKSTFLRQNALIAILAQMGAFVPASRAEIGVVDQVFSRVGAADDLARGRSTFMVEMVETAAILNQAGPRALVILDEIGRGTATYDGLSIAWATLEHLHEVNGCRALFATHYHELTALDQRLNGLRNVTMAVREHEGQVIFLHEVQEGAADRSYGVQVARLAGLPTDVVERARAVLDRLESADRGQGAQVLIDDLPLFRAAPAAPPPAPAETPLRDRLVSVAPAALSPREALDLVYELKALADDPG